MTGFLAVLAPPGRSEAARPPWLAALTRQPPPGWEDLAFGRERVVLRRVRRGPAVRALGARGLLIGELFPKSSAGEPDLARLADGDPDRVRRRLIEDHWGPYVHIDQDPASGAVSVLRGPGGELEALVWRTDGLVVVASGLPEWVDPALPVGLSLDWAQLGALVVDSTQLTGALALRGLQGLAPGEVWREGTCRQLWRPADLARARGSATRERTGRLVGAVDEAVARLGSGRILLELSGGLDSAIVASALARAAAEDVVALNYHVDDRQGDERAFARDVAARLGIQLIEAHKAEAGLDLAALAELSRGARPALGAFDHQHDADVAARCQAQEIDVVLTGQGGDNVFFQTPTPLIAADSMAALCNLPRLADLARWQGRSVYGVARAGLAGRLRPDAILSWGVPAHAGAAAREAALAASPHPWLADLSGVAPAKRLQIAGLANTLVVLGETRRGQIAPVRHPLLAQPVLEAWLPVSAGELTRGGERGLARQAFAARLPPALIARRTKGRLSAHYGRTLALSLPVLRPVLLEGRLAEQGLIARAAVDAMLSPEHLIWRGGYGVLIHLAMLELWVRGWEDRIGRRAAARSADGGR